MGLFNLFKKKPKTPEEMFNEDSKFFRLNGLLLSQIAWQSKTPSLQQIKTEDINNLKTEKKEETSFSY